MLATLGESVLHMAWHGRPATPIAGLPRALVALRFGHSLKVEVAERVLGEAAYVIIHTVDKWHIDQCPDRHVTRPVLLNLIVQPLARGRIIRLLRLVRELDHRRIVVPGVE